MNGKEAHDIRLGIRVIRVFKNNFYRADTVLSCGSSTILPYGLSKQAGTGRMNTIFVPHLKTIHGPPPCSLHSRLLDSSTSLAKSSPGVDGTMGSQRYNGRSRNGVCSFGLTPRRVIDIIYVRNTTQSIESLILRGCSFNLVYCLFNMHIMAQCKRTGAVCQLIGA